MSEPFEIEVDYTLSYKEFATAHRFATRQHPFLFFINVLARYVAVASAVFFLLLTYSAYQTGGIKSATYTLVLVLLMLAVPLTLSYSQRTAYNRLRMSNDSAAVLRFQANAHEFVRHVVSMGELRWNWSAAQGMKANKSFLIIAARKGAYIFIPRRVLNDAQVARLQAMYKESHPC